MLRCMHNIPKRCSGQMLCRHIHANQRNLKEMDENEKTNAYLERIKQEIAKDRAEMKWRTPIGDRPEDWNSKLKLFADSEQTSDYIVMMQKPINLSPKAIKAWWKKRQERIERHMQQYVPERIQILGPDLGAAHFILYRGGAVKFTHNPGWMRANKDNQFNLPDRFNPNYKLEAIRCDNMNLYYEGLENLRCLENLKFLSFHNVKTFDDWCLDRISGSQCHALEVLDISGTQCTYNGLSCLYRLPNLKLLILENPTENIEWQLSCAMLEEVIPKLKIVASEAVHKKESN